MLAYMTAGKRTLQLKAHGIARPKCVLLVSSFIDVSSKNRTVVVRQHCVCSVWIQFWTFGEVAGSVGVTVVAYMTAKIVQLKARYRPLGITWIRFWREISGARPRMLFGGKVVSPPRSTDVLELTIYWLCASSSPLFGVVLCIFGEVLFIGPVYCNVDLLLSRDNILAVCQ